MIDIRNLLLLLTIRILAETSFTSQKLDVNYDKRLSPYFINGKAVNVSLTIPFLLLVNVNEEEQIVSWLFTFTLIWRDDRLRYSPSQFGNESKIFVPNSQVWIPRFIIYNSIEQRKLIDDDRNDVSILPDGTVKMQVTQYVNTICELKVQRMPFDTQHCALQIASPLQSRRYAVMHGNINENPAMIKGDSEFTYKNLTIYEYDYDLDGEKMHEVNFIAEFKRCPNFFIIVIVIPSFLITAMTITGILLPVNEKVGGDAIQVGLASMLALSITLSVVAETLPRTANVPLIALYILTCLGICSISVICGLVLTYLKGHQSKPSLPKVFRKLFRRNQALAMKEPREDLNRATDEPTAQIEIIKRLYISSFGVLQFLLLLTLIIFLSFW